MKGSLFQQLFVVRTSLSSATGVKVIHFMSKIQGKNSFGGSIAKIDFCRLLQLHEFAL